MTRLAFGEGNDRITVPDWSARVFADCANHHSPNQTPTQWMMPGDSVRAYAERRGLVPASEIMLRERPVASEQAVSAQPRRRLFAGLKLDAGRPAGSVAVLLASPASVLAPMDRDGGTERLARSVVAYAQAWGYRMRQAGLPVCRTRSRRWRRPARRSMRSVRASDGTSMRR
jgi:hypothetical protein